MSVGSRSEQGDDLPRETILVVDDVADNRTIAAKYLTAGGYRVLLAVDGNDALHRFEEHPDLVLLDIVMPGLDGYETCQRMRALPDGRDTPIVFLTALNELDSYRQAMNAGPDDFLMKPVGRTELIIRVRSLLRIRRLNRELKRSYDIVAAQRDALASLQRQKDELTALLVHDMKTPLTITLLEAQFVSERTTANPAVQEALDNIISSTESMHRMAMNLLDVGRSEDGVLVPVLAEVPLEGLVHGACARMMRRAREREQTLSVSVSTGEPIRADGDLLQRVLDNLLDNCLRHAPAGGKVHVDASRASDGAFELSVSDDGPGVALADRDRIFEKYVQLESAGAPVTRTSRGLGLLFCRLAVEAHGGRIGVEDNQPHGSTFRVRLPARPEDFVLKGR